MNFFHLMLIFGVNVATLYLHTQGKRKGLILMSDEERSQINISDNNKEYTVRDLKKTALFEFGEENILDRSKKSLAKLSWFQRLFK